ncbi:MAG: hypothetical protein SGILL_005156 [Bacillariaceae sp.]
MKFRTRSGDKDPLLCSYPINDREKTMEFANILFPSEECERAANVGRPTAINPSGIRQKDLNSLADRTMLNGQVIDVFRKACYVANQHGEASNWEIYPTDFYRLLKSHEGTNQEFKKWKTLSSPFTRKFICIPLCAGVHWRLLVLINPSEILNETINAPMCCILALDSSSSTVQKAENKSGLLRDWLNAEWNRSLPDQKKDPFTARSFPSFAPSVPQQGNDANNDCGIHTMLAIRGMLKLRDQPLLKSSSDWFTKDLRKLSGFSHKANEARAFRREFREFIHQLKRESITSKRKAGSISDGAGDIEIIS